MPKPTLTLEGIKSIDKSNMLDLLLGFPQQCQDAYRIGLEAAYAFEKKPYKAIVFAGVGGSGIGADIVRAYVYSKAKIPVAVCREYILPAYVDEATCVFILSYSGNSQEAISAYAQARTKRALVIVLSSGGLLEQFAMRDGIKYIKIPSGLPPRYAIGYLSIIPLCILERFGLIQGISDAIRSTIKTLKQLSAGMLGPAVRGNNNIAKRAASKLLNKLVVVYTSSLNFDAVADRLRAQINENAKALASSNVFPEFGHNEIMGWQNPKKIFKDVVVLFFRDAQCHKQVAKSMDVARELLKKEGIAVLEVWSHGDDLLSRIFSLLYIGDFISFYLAILYKTDPAPTERITYLKKKLS